MRVRHPVPGGQDVGNPHAEVVIEHQDLATGDQYIVDQNVHRSEFIGHLGKQIIDLFGIADVGLDGDTFTPGRGNLLENLRCLVRITGVTVDGDPAPA